MGSGLRFLGIIPARYASSRFPGKPLEDIFGKPMIQHVYERASQALEMVYVATDDNRIYEAVIKFGGRAAMTSAGHKSGTDRCAEAAEIAEREQGVKYDAVLNIQGDEPFINTEQIELVKSCFQDNETQIATLVKEISSVEDLLNENRPKVVLNMKGQALYFSRSSIPFNRGTSREQWLSHHKYYMHIGLYGFRRDILPRVTSLPQSPLELSESLEQLRWLEHGFTIAVRTTQHESFGIDTPEDPRRALDAYRKGGI